MLVAFPLSNSLFSPSQAILLRVLYRVITFFFFLIEEGKLSIQRQIAIFCIFMMHFKSFIDLCFCILL